MRAMGLGEAASGRWKQPNLDTRTPFVDKPLGTSRLGFIMFFFFSLWDLSTEMLAMCLAGSTQQHGWSKPGENQNSSQRLQPPGALPQKA
jgi:hypothetical protein